MKKVIFIAFIATSLFALSENDLLKQAKEFENQSNYKEAMLLYKKIANKNFSEINEKEKNIINAKSNVTTNLKEEKVGEIPKEVKPLVETVNTIEDEETMTTVEQMIASSFKLYPYKENYFFPVSYDTKSKNDRKQNEAKFQFSFKKPMFHNVLGLDETYYFAYTQTSWWQLYDNSSPFRETNYQPEFYVTIPYGQKDKTLLKGFKSGFLHESNGQAGVESESWNRIYLETYLQFHSLFIIPRVWYNIDKDENEKGDRLEDFMGYGDITFMYPYKENIFKLMVRNNLKSDNKGFVQLDWTFPFFNSKNTFAHIQISNGYGDSIIDYDKEITRISFGISLSR